MILLQEGHLYDFPLRTYYIESVDELAQIPANVPAGTIVECNIKNPSAPVGALSSKGDFKVFMKLTDGTWNEL